MATIKLPDRILDDAKIAAAGSHRSVPKQLEHWITLGKAAEDNPDLPLGFIRDIFEAISEIEAGAELTEFKFGQ